MKGIIYCYHCIPTGKKYIGQTIYENRRKNQHKRDCKKGVDNKFYRAVRRYGWDMFIYGIIGEYNIDDINRQEIYLIEYYNTYCDGYNSTIGGEGVRGFKPSEETKKKQSISAKNRKCNNKKYFTEEEKIDAKRKRDREYQQKIKERRKEYMKEWRENNQDKIKKWKEENSDYLKDLWKRGREKNRERRKEYSRWYYHNVVKTVQKLSQEDKKMENSDVE